MPNDYHVNIYPLAEKDMEDIFRYIHDKLLNPSAAQSLIDLFEKSIRELASFPFMYPFIENEFVSNSTFRKMIVKNYIVVYRVIDEEVQILRIFNARKNYINEM